MTIKEYSTSRGISYEAAAKQIRRYKNKELKKHISFQGALTILDDYAVDFLDGHRQPRNIVVAPTDEETHKELQRLYNEVDRLKDQIIRLQDERGLLIEEKAKNEILLQIAGKEREELGQAKKDLETAKIDLELLKANAEQSAQELSRYKPTLFGLYKRT